MKTLLLTAMGFLLLFVAGFTKEAYDSFTRKSNTHYVLPSHPSTNNNPYTF